MAEHNGDVDLNDGSAELRAREERRRRRRTVRQGEFIRRLVKLLLRLLSG
jgi:hypothetical protein